MRHAQLLTLALLALPCAACSFDHPNFLDPAERGLTDGGTMGAPDGGTPPTPRVQVRTGTTVSAGGGVVESADHKARLIIGAPMPSGRLSSADHRATLGTEPLLKP